MDMIRRQAESAAEDTALLGVRELPSVTQAVAETTKADVTDSQETTADVSTDALNFKLPTGGQPWTEAEDIREKRRLRALARKAIRASRRAEQAEEG